MIEGVNGVPNNNEESASSSDSQAYGDNLLERMQQPGQAEAVQAVFSGTHKRDGGLSDEQIATKILDNPEVRQRLTQYVESRRHGDPVVLDDPNWGLRRMQELRKQIEDRDKPTA